MKLKVKTKHFNRFISEQNQIRKIREETLEYCAERETDGYYNIDFVSSASKEELADIITASFNLAYNVYESEEEAQEYLDRVYKKNVSRGYYG